jgi:hypothetical protein
MSKLAQNSPNAANKTAIKSQKTKEIFWDQNRVIKQATQNIADTT